MKSCILKASPHKNGNTNKITDCFIEELENHGVSCSIFNLYDMNIKPCLGCRKCQDVYEVASCIQKDDMEKIYDEVLKSDLIVFSTPIYSWYATAPLKAVTDRMVYGLCKYYGKEKKTSLINGKNLALITTCGYPPKKGADLFEEGMKRYCRHTGMNYVAMLAERHLGYDTVFMDEEKAKRAKDFAVDTINFMEKQRKV